MMSYSSTPEEPVVLRAAETAFLASKSYHYQFTNRRSLQHTPHSHDFYEVLIGLSGSCVHKINSAVHTISSSSMHILRPGDVHSFHDQTEDTNLFVLSVWAEDFDKHISAYGDRLQNLLPHAKDALVLSLSRLEWSELSNCLDRLNTLDAENTLCLSKIITGKILQFALFDTIPARSHNVPKKFLSAVEQMSKEENLAEGIPALLRLSNYSRPQLCRIMQNYANMTPQQYVFKLRMTKAYELLLNTEYNQQTIAEMVGFSSLSHFSKVFHQYFGVTPASIRKSVVPVSV